MTKRDLHGLLNQHIQMGWDAAIEAEAAAPAGLDVVREALTDEDEIAHGEAYHDGGLGVCAYCGDEWPCRTQRGIDRLLARLLQDTEDER